MIIAILLVLVIVSSSILAYEYLMAASLQRQNQSLSGQNRSLSSDLATQSASYAQLESSYLADANTTPVLQSFQLHTAHIDEKNATAVASDYASNATMIWEGTTFGLGGSYTGSGNIEFTWQTFLGGAKNVTVTIRSVNATALANETVMLHADLFFEGYSVVVGSFNATTSGTYSYVFFSGAWKIAQEVTLFTQAHTEYSCGAGGPCTP